MCSSLSCANCNGQLWPKLYDNDDDDTPVLRTIAKQRAIKHGLAWICYLFTHQNRLKLHNITHNTRKSV